MNRPEVKNWGENLYSTPVGKAKRAHLNETSFYIATMKLNYGDFEEKHSAVCRDSVLRIVEHSDHKNGVYGAVAETIVRSKAQGFYKQRPGSPPMHLHTDEVPSFSPVLFLKALMGSAGQKTKTTKHTPRTVTIEQKCLSSYPMLTGHSSDRMKSSLM